MDNIPEEDLTKLTYLQIITGLLCEPEEDTVNSAELFDKLLEVSRKLKPDAGETVKKIIDLQPFDVRKLLVEYARLFIGPFMLPAPPYSSLFLGTKQLNNEITDWVRDFYASCGLQFDDRIMDMPDHIAVETEFLAYLIGKKCETNLTGDTGLASSLGLKFNEFIMQHYLPWTSVFSDVVCRETKEDFYVHLFHLISQVTVALA